MSNEQFATAIVGIVVLMFFAGIGYAVWAGKTRFQRGIAALGARERLAAKLSLRLHNGSLDGGDPISGLDAASLRDKLLEFEQLRKGRGLIAENVFFGPFAGGHVWILSAGHWEHAGRRTTGSEILVPVVQTVALFESEALDLPELAVRPNSLLQKDLLARGVELPDAPELAKTFQVTGPDAAAIRAFLTPERAQRLLPARDAWLEGRGRRVLIFRKQKVLPEDRLEWFSQEVAYLVSALSGR